MHLVEGVSSEMVELTNSKFLAWDNVVDNNLLDSGDEQILRETYLLLDDPTIYAYAFFKNKDNLPMKLYPYQDLIINDSHKRIIMCSGNQIGKSLALCIKALTFALKNPGKTVLLVSKTFTQCKDLLRQIKNFLKTSSLSYQYDVGDTETKTEIYFKHFELRGEEQVELQQSRIICVPATEAALGYPVDLLLIDEIAFFDNGEYFYKQIAQPRTYTTKGSIIIFSNPNGQTGIMWDLWNDENFHRYRFNFLDCPTNTQEEFDLVSKSLTREQVDSTLLAIFTNPAGGFLTFQERKAMQEERPNLLPSIINSPIYIFFDFAKTQDRTVRSIGIPFGKGVYIYELLEYPQGTPYNKIIDELESLVRFVGPKYVSMVGWDNTGVGSGINDFIRKIEDIGVMCTPVEFSLQNKSSMYTVFKLLVEKNLRGEQGIKMPFVQACDKQFSSLRFTRSSRGYLQVHHESESDRDDYCFVAGTLVLTDRGNVPIESLRVGDFVRTRNGFSRVSGVSSRFATVISHFGLTGTPDHPFILFDRIEKFKNLKESDLLYTWNEKQSTIKICGFTDIQNLKGDSCESITGHTQTETSVQSLYTEQFGKKKLVKSLKDMLFTIKTAIHLITNYLTWSACPEAVISLDTHQQKKLRKKQEVISHYMHDQKLVNGINLWKEKGFIERLVSCLGKILFLQSENVSCVDKSSMTVLGGRIGGSVQKSVMKKSGISTGRLPKQLVYNLSVEGAHEYFANNILVHNCDSVVGLCSLIVAPDNVPVTCEII